MRWNTFHVSRAWELLEFLDSDGRDGRTGVLVCIGSTDRKPRLVLTWLDKPEEALRGNRRQQGGQTVAGHRDRVGREYDLNVGIIALRVDKPEPGQGKNLPAKLNHERGRLRRLPRPSANPQRLEWGRMLA